jgi:hypothetical protein
VEHPHHRDWPEGRRHKQVPNESRDGYSSTRPPLRTHPCAHAASLAVNPAAGYRFSGARAVSPTSGDVSAGHHCRSRKAGGLPAPRSPAAGHPPSPYIGPV